MSNDKIIADQNAAVDHLRHESNQLKTDAQLWSSVGITTLPVTLMPNMYEHAQKKVAPKWMHITAIVAAATGIITFTSSILKNLKARNIEQTLDKIPTLPSSSDSANAFQISAMDQKKDSWEEKLRKNSHASADIQK